MKRGLVRWGVSCVLLCAMVSIAQGEKTVTTAWKVVEGAPSGWDFRAGKIRCEVTNAGPHRILSEKIIEGDWALDAEIERSGGPSDASQSILFTVAEDLSYGYILTLKGAELSLTRMVKGEDEASWVKDITSSGVRGDILGFGTDDYSIEVDSFLIGSPGKPAIMDDFNSGLDKWDCYTGKATTRDGKLKLSSNGPPAHNEGVRTVAQVAPKENLEAVMEVTGAAGTGGYQVNFKVTTDDSSYIEIQRRFGAFVSSFVFQVVPGLELPVVNVPDQNRHFKVKITCDPSTGVSAGYYDLLDGKGWAKIGDTAQIEATRTKIKTWPVSVDPAVPRHKLRIAKRGGTSTFILDGRSVGTITNPKLRSGSRTIALYKDPEPNKGRYGFAFDNQGTYTVSKFRLRPVRSVQKYQGNPLLPSFASKGAWDENQAFPATIRKFEDTYYLYYSGVDATDARLEGGGIGRIGVATSKDGCHFVKYEKNPVFDRMDGNTGRSLKVQGMAVVRLPDGKYALTYTVWDGRRWGALEYAVSASPLGPFELGPHNPMITTGAAPGFDEGHLHLHNMVRLDDGSYAMLYTGFGRVLGHWGDRGGLATSVDFTKWTKYSGNPVFPLGEPGAWDDGHVRPKGFIQYGDYYYLFYEGAHYAEQVSLWFDQVGMARSRDLIHWERYPYNPIIPIDAGGGRDTIVTEWPTPIATKEGLAVFYWGGMPGDVAISRADIPRELLEEWGDGDK